LVLLGDVDWFVELVAVEVVDSSSCLPNTKLTSPLRAKSYTEAFTKYILNCFVCENVNRYWEKWSAVALDALQRI